MKISKRKKGCEWIKMPLKQWVELKLQMHGDS